MTKPGITTNEIDEHVPPPAASFALFSHPNVSIRFVHNLILEKGGYPSPLNYKKFPKSCCTSPNEVICHGIPDDTVLKDGDILNLDVCVYYQGALAVQPAAG